MVIPGQALSRCGIEVYQISRASPGVPFERMCPGARALGHKMKGTMRRSALLILTLGICFTPQNASAVTVDEIVQLANAGISDAVILALLDRDRTVLTIAPEDLVVLKQDGLSDALIIAMLKSGREEAEAAMRAESEANAARI